MRIWRELNAISINDIAEELGIPPNRVIQFEKNLNDENIWEWYLRHGFLLEDYNYVNEKHQRKKEEIRKKKESTS